MLSALMLVAAALTGSRLVDGPLPAAIGWIFAYLGLQALSIPLGVHPSHSLSCYAGSWVLLFPLVFVLALGEPTRRDRLVAALLIGGTLVGVYGLVQHVQGIDWLHGREPLEAREGRYIAVGNFGGHLTYAGVQLPLVFLALGVALDRTGRARALAGTAAVVLAASVVVSFARTTWVGLIAGLALVLLSLSWRARLTIAAGAGVAVVGLLSQSSGLATRLASIATVTELPRWRLWETALRIVAEHPVFGAGLGSYPTLFPDFKVPGEYKSTIHPHSDILNAAVETGVLGAAAWIGIWIAFFVATRHRPARTDRRWTVVGIRAGVLALLVAGLGQCFSTDEEVAAVWFSLVGFALVETRVSGGRPWWRGLEKRFKASTLPVARRWFASGGTSRPPRDAERLLVVRHDDRLGNLLLMTPFLARLREARPDAHIGMAIGSGYEAISAAWPWVDEWIVQDKRAQASRPWVVRDFVRTLRRSDWDAAFEMSNHNTHSYSSCLMTLVSGAPVRIGFDEPRNAATLTHVSAPPGAETHFSLAPFRLFEHLEIDPPIARLQCPLPDADVAPVDPRTVVVHLDGRGGKALDIDTWNRFLHEVGDLAVGRPAAVRVLGVSPEDRPRLDALDRPEVEVVPPASIVEVAHLVRGADAFVGCDTGVMHLAVAVGTRTVGVFFRSNPYHYAPLGAEHATVLLANPYAVTADGWAAGVERSRLFPARWESSASERGVPVRGADACRAMLEAVAHVGHRERSHS